MKVLEINQVRTDENFIYYRRNYTAQATIQLVQRNLLANIIFTIETNPLGEKIIYVDFEKGTDIDYPLIPVKSALKSFILTMDNEGKLPCC